MINHSR